MSDTVRNLEPKSLWNHFSDLNAVPRPSKKEERVIAFMKSFGESLGLETKVDHIGNVIITKPASPGREKDTTVVLQSHLDMVHQKNNDTKFDFDREGIRMTVDGDWVKADGTTLGADNGIGVASIMAILSSKTISHPPLEALFTIDEETGIVVYGPEIVSRGFVFENETGHLLEDAKCVILEVIEEVGPDVRERTDKIRSKIQVALRKYFSFTIRRRPIILAFILEV